MKIGIMKIGANITQSKSIRSAANYDIFSLMDLLKNDHEISIITKKTRNTVLAPQYDLIEINELEDINSYGLDCILFFNGAINFFGGAESPETMKYFRVMNNFVGRVYYIVTDIRYPLYQILDFVKGKDWGVKYQQDEQNYLTVRTDIRYIYQGRSRKALQTILDKRNSKRIVPIQSENIHHFPIEWAIMANEPKLIATPWDTRTIDLIYGGANRDSHRKNRLTEYFYDNPLNVLTFGPVKIHPTVPSTGTVAHNEFMRVMSRAKATIIVGDRTYHNNFFTLRMYESILAGCITFIDLVFDKEKVFYQNDKALQEFLYVKTQKELVHKLNSLSEADYKLIANKQLQCIRSQHESIEKYKESLERVLQQ